MNPPRPLRQYWAYLYLALKDELWHWPVLVGRLVFFAMLMLIFSRLWQVTLRSGFAEQWAAADLLWYLAATEWILLSVPAVHFRIEAEIRQGNYVYALLRPVPYLAQVLSDALGRLLLAQLLFGSVGFAFTYLAAGSAPPVGPGIWVFLALGFVAALVLILVQTAIGITALWLHDIAPLYWIWQKLLFILGGLMLPLSLYPAWLHQAAQWLPFQALLYAPARLILALDWAKAAESLLLLLCWGTLAAALLWRLERVARRNLLVGGG